MTPQDERDHAKYSMRGTIELDYEVSKICQNKGKLTDSEIKAAVSHVTDLEYYSMEMEDPNSAVSSMEQFLEGNTAVSDYDKEAILQHCREESEKTSEVITHLRKSRNESIHSFKSSDRKLKKMEESLKTSIRKNRILNILFGISLSLCVIMAGLCAYLYTSSSDTPSSSSSKSVSSTQSRYVASSESDKYHRLTCDFADNILPENRIFYKTAEDAIKDGKQPCTVCLPSG